MCHRRSQDFVWGALYAKKVGDLLLVVTLKDGLSRQNLKNLTRQAKNCPINFLHNFPVNYA